MNDGELLQEYAGRGSQRAFATLVSRHLNLVYSVARRQVASPQLAEEIAQSVFLDLASQASRLRPGASLVSWLFVVTRRTAINAAQAESRRRAREQTAWELSEPGRESSCWSDLEPLLDGAIESLPPADRTAVMLRFFEGRALREVGQALGLSDDAAQKRLSRAIERMRAYFGRRGVRVAAAGLAAGMSSHGVVAAPAGLSASITAAAALLPAGAAAGSIAVVGLGAWLKTIAAAAAVISLTAVVSYNAGGAGKPAPAEDPPVQAAMTPPFASMDEAAQDAAALAGPAPMPAVVPGVAGGRNALELARVVNPMLARGTADFDRGERLFRETGCQMCHLLGGRGGRIGPDLTGTGGRFGTYEILQAITEPSAAISDLHGMKEFQMTDGRRERGRVVAESGNELHIQTRYEVDPVSGFARWDRQDAAVIDLAGVAAINESESSVMPSGLIDRLTEAEVADLIAYLVSGGDRTNRLFRASGISLSQPEP